MKKLTTLLSISLFLLFFCSNSYSKNIAIGVTPSILELGTLKRESSELATFYIVTPSEDTMLIYLNTLRGTFDFFNKDRYKDMVFNYSEEDTTSWLKILSNPVELKTTNDSLGLSRSNVKGHRDINLILNIPNGAEPGYHLLGVVPSPATKNEATGGIGTQMVAVSPVRILFNIPGEAIRKGKILDVSSGKSGNNHEVDIHFLNTGTVTISARATKILIKDEKGNLVKELTSTLEYVKPGEIKVLKVYIPIEEIDYGTYNVFVHVDYTTGSAEFNSVITFKPSIIKEITGEAQKIQFKLNWWIILLLIIIIVLIYRWLRR